MKTGVLWAALLIAYVALFQGSRWTGGDRLDPLSPAPREVEHAIAVGRFDDALPIALDLQQTYPDEPLVAQWLSRIYRGLGRRTEEASAWERFKAVTVPSIRHVVLVVTLLSSIWTANSFENIWIMTQGGPSDATMVFPVLAYFGMQTQRIGEAAAVSVYMLPVLAILVIFATSLMMRRED